MVSSSNPILMDKDSGFDDKEFLTTPYLKLIEDKEGATCICYQMRLHGKLHFVKKIKPSFENDSRMRAAFRKENEIGFSLSHPNFPRYVFMEGIFSPEEYVVTDWIDGETLDKFIEHNPKYFSERNNIKRLINQLTDALDYIHRHGIIHGDLKPSNIMMSKNGERAILLDLGLSISNAHTLTGGYTYDFAAPELIKGELATEATDYYSLGKIIGFIESHTVKRLPKEILALKKALISFNKSKRIHTKEEIYKNLENKRERWIWLTILPVLGILVWFVTAIGNKDSSNDQEVFISQEPIFKEENNNTQPYSQALETFQPEEPIYKKNDKKIILEPTEISNDYIVSEKEKIKEEVNRRLKLNYTTLINRIDSLTLANDFSVDRYFAIIEEAGEAMKRSITDRYYYEKYPSIPKEEVVFITTTEFSNFCNNIWNPKIENYYKNIPM